MSGTPRTEASKLVLTPQRQQYLGLGWKEIVDAEFARVLEREIIALQSELSRTKVKFHEHLQTLNTQRNALALFGKL